MFSREVWYQKIKTFGLVWPLLLLAGHITLACTGNEAQQKGPSSRNEAHWTGLYSTASGLRSVIHRKDGVFNLIVYQGKTLSGNREINPIMGYLVSLGYNVITTENPSPHPSRTTGPGERRNHLIYALDRPGYRNRIVVTYGSELTEILLSARDQINRVGGWIIIDPPGMGNEILKLPEIEAGLESVSSMAPVLWFHTGKKMERIHPSIERIFQSDVQIHATDPLSLTDSGNDFTFPVKLIQNDSFTNYLLLLKYRIKWKSATEVFPGGCRTRGDRIVDLKKKSFRVSGDHTADFCPLFMITARQGEFYRAEDVADENCAYRLSNSRTVLYCQ